MSAVTVQQMAERIAALMQERLGTRGRDLSEKLRRGGRALPRRVRREAEYLAAMAKLAQQPKVLLMLDHARIAQAYDICLRHLKGLGSAERAIGMALGMLGSVAFAVLVVGGLFVAVLVWRGLI